MRFQPSCEARNSSDSVVICSLSSVAYSSAGREECPFLHGTLSETVYYAQSSGFEDPAHPDYVCRLNKSLYGLKQAPRDWYSRFAAHLLSLGFVEARSDTSLFVFHRGSDTVYLLLYVDDIVLTASSTELLRRTITAL